MSSANAVFAGRLRPEVADKLLGLVLSCLVGPDMVIYSAGV